MISSLLAVADWARGGGSTRIVNRPGRGGKHYDPGGRRDVAFSSSGPTYRRPGSVISKPTRGNPITPSARVPRMRGEFNMNGTGRTPNPHTRNFPAAKPPAVSSRMAPANPAKRHQPQRVIDGGYNVSEHLSASAESSFRAGSRSRPGSHFPVAAPQRFPGSSARAAGRTHANEFVSAQKAHDSRVLADGRGKYSSKNDPVGARMRAAQSGLTSEIIGNVGDILMMGIGAGSLAGGGGLVRAATAGLAGRGAAKAAATIRRNPAVVRRNQRELKIPGGGGARPPIEAGAPRLNPSLPKKPIGVRPSPTVRPPRPQLPTPPPARGIPYKPPTVPTSPLRIGSPPVRPSGIPFRRSSSAPSHIGIRKDAPAPAAAAPKTPRKARKPRAVKGRQRQ